MSLQDRVLDADIPQAFSHWTHRFTKRTRLVCDLQGQLSLDDRYPVFELTDPCIHSTSGKWFGRTDRGFRGVQDFFNTHQCNHLCNILGIANDSYRPWMVYWKGLCTVDHFAFARSIFYTFTFQHAWVSMCSSLFLFMFLFFDVLFTVSLHIFDISMCGATFYLLWSSQEHNRTWLIICVSINFHLF